MRSMWQWMGLCALVGVTACLETKGESEGCSADAECGDGLVCDARICRLPDGGGGGGGDGVGGGGGAAPECASDDACATGICQDDGRCCPLSCADAVCAEVRCGRRCQADCSFEPLGGESDAGCGRVDWPSARSATPFAALGGGRFLLFSGDDYPDLAGPDLWELTLHPTESGRVTASWEQLPAPVEAPLPPARFGHLLMRLPEALCRAHGAPDECVLLWGGRTRTGIDQGLSGTWLWARATGFVPLSLPIEPSERLYPAVAIDPGGERLILFGGWLCPDSGREGCDYDPIDDTWVFDAGGWRELSPSVRPTARGRASLAGPLPDGRFVLVGGRGADGGGPAVAYQALWFFDGAEWAQQLEESKLTTVRELQAAFWAPGAVGVVVHGGMAVAEDGGAGPSLGDTQLLPIEPGEGPVALAALVSIPRSYRSWGWDPTLGLVVFGGEADRVVHCDLQRLLIR